MPKTKISEFSATPGNNTDIDGINIAEGCAPSGINDAIRELMAQLKDFQAGTAGDSFNGPVGTSTAAAGAFTTLSSTGNTTLGDASGDAVTINGATTFVNVSPTITPGTANGVAYLNGSKVLTTGSALTYNGTAMQINAASFPALKFGDSGATLKGEIYYGVGGNDINIVNYANGPIGFIINGSEQARLTSTGLGIGTSSPSGKLHVVGDSLSNTFKLIANTTVSGSDATIFRPADNTMAFSTNGAERLRIDSSGNLGLGVTPSAWGTTKALEFSYGSFSANSSLGTDVAGNCYYNGTNWIYRVTGVALRYNQATAGHSWHVASGTAGNAISFTQALTLDASGNLLVGTTSSTLGRLEVVGGTGIRVNEDAAGTKVIQVRSAFAGGDPAINVSTNHALAFNTNNTERARIDSSGNLLVGTTSTVNPGGVTGTSSFKTATSSKWAGAFEHAAASGQWGVGVSYSGGAPNGTSNAFFYGADTGGDRFFMRSNGGLANYSANNVNLSDARLKTDIKLAGDYLAKICAIPVKTFLYKDQTDNEPNLGVIAQEVEAVAPELVDKSGFGATPDDGIPYKTIYQTDLQYALMKAIQEQQAIINQLKARLDAANL